MSGLQGRQEEGKCLKDIADVIVGQIMTRVTSKDGTGEHVSVLMPKAITRGAIIKENLGEAVLAKPAGNEKYTREGDVVIKLAAPYEAAYVEKDNEGLLVPSFCAVVRITEDDGTDAKYLSAFLNSSYVRGLLAVMVDVGRPMIKIGDIRRLVVPKVSARDMKDIGEAHILSGQKKAVLRAMIKAEDTLMENIVLASIKGGGAV